MSLSLCKHRFAMISQPEDELAPRFYRARLEVMKKSCALFANERKL